MEYIKICGYSVTIKKDFFGGELLFEAKVLEFPDLMDYAENFEECYELIKDSIETTIEIFKEKGKEIPKPNE